MINLQFENRHKEFFGVLCLHSYYFEQISRDLVFEPSPETAAMLRNYGLIFKPADFGFVVLYTPDFSPERLKVMPPKTRLSFHLKNKNPKFMNFSEIPFWPEGVTFHYSNLCQAEREMEMKVPRDVYYYFKGLKVGDVRKKLLHLPEHVLLSKLPKRFSYSVSGSDGKGIAYADLKVQDEYGQEMLAEGTPYKRRFRDVNKDLFKRHLSHATRNLGNEGLSPSAKEKRIIEIGNELEAEMEKNPSVDLAVDLRHVPQGKYTISAGKNHQQEVYVTDNPEAKVFGILDIYVDAAKDALLNRNAQSLDELIQPQLYYLNFEARSTYWRYIFVNMAESKIAPKLIRDENGALSFSEPMDGVLEQVGTQIKFVESENAIPLKDRPEHVLFLARMNGKRSMKEVRVPTPVPDFVRPEKREGEPKDRIYSEVYVYL